MNLVPIVDVVPDAMLDLRYTTIHNLAGKILDNASSVARLDAAAVNQLALAADDFKILGLRLVIWDAFRSEQVQAELRAIDPDERYVLKRSQHCLGLAVDITLADTEGRLLDMGTDHDDFSERAHADTVGITDLQRSNRQTLATIMSRHGFVVWPYEWWHFDFVQK